MATVVLFMNGAVPEAEKMEIQTCRVETIMNQSDEVSLSETPTVEQHQSRLWWYVIVIGLRLCCALQVI